MTFEILIDDGSRDLVSDYALNENNKAVELYKWQREAIEYFFENKHKAIYNCPTGAGKSFLAIEILKRILDENKDVRILIVVPKNIILEDTWYKELDNNGISLKDIGLYYGKVKEYAKITITNVQNLSNINFELFDCLVLDECHHTTKRIFKIITQKEWKFLLGLSATYQRRDRGHWELLKIFNYNVFDYTPRQALDDCVLNPFNFMNIGVELDDETMEQYNELTRKLNLIFLAHGGFAHIMKSNLGIKNQMLFLFNERKKLVSNYYRKFDVAKEICLKHKDDKIIIFNNFNKQTNDLYWHLLETGVKSCVVHSSMDPVLREQNLIDYRAGKFNVILCTKVLDEGYNLPKVQVAIIMAGETNDIQTIQRMGRVLRKSKNKNRSELYQIFCKDTIEDEYAENRSKLFKELCSNYREASLLQNDERAGI